MKKLITLTNFKTGITKNFITGEVRKVDAADEKKRIELLAKNTAELYNAGVKNLLKKEEEKRNANVISAWKKFYRLKNAKSKGWF